MSESIETIRQQALRWAAEDWAMPWRDRLAMNKGEFIRHRAKAYEQVLKAIREGKGHGSSAAAAA